MGTLIREIKVLNQRSTVKMHMAYVFKHVICGDWLGLRRGSSLKNNTFWEVGLHPFLVLGSKGYFGYFFKLSHELAHIAE